MQKNCRSDQELPISIQAKYKGELPDFVSSAVNAIASYCNIQGALGHPAFAVSWELEGSEANCCDFNDQFRKQGEKSYKGKLEAETNLADIPVQGIYLPARVLSLGPVSVRVDAEVGITMDLTGKLSASIGYHTSDCDIKMYGKRCTETNGSAKIEINLKGGYKSDACYFVLSDPEPLRIPAIVTGDSSAS